MKIAIGADHAGFVTKAELIKNLKSWQHEITDVGTFTLEATDYPLFALKVGEAVASNKVERGILICGNGIGMSIVANKIPGIRAALVLNEKIAVQTREHNDSNILVLAGREIEVAENIKITQIWLTTQFSFAERHVRRIKLINRIEKHITDHDDNIFD
jgi:ribose 5-phosphate isomerase B